MSHPFDTYLMQDGLDVVVIGFALQLTQENFGRHPLRGEVRGQGALVTVEDAVEVSILVENHADRSILKLVQWSSKSILNRCGNEGIES